MVTRIVMSPSGTRIAASSTDCAIKIWQTKNCALVATLEGHSHWVQSVCWLSEHELISASMDCTLLVWDLTQQPCSKALTAHTSCVWDVAVNTIRTLVASSSWDNSVIIWGLPGHEKRRTIFNTEIKKSGVGFHPFWTAVLAVGLTSGNIGIYDVRDGALLREISAHTRPLRRLQFSKSGRLIASASEDCSAKFISLHSSHS
eukprot:TRINITY_DN950_c0_g1_i3.p1 TRINITY_DN950_c0_g1~~TRINITY_DN950_c0_g1_i3.p1  ORF type:complete len:236 (+),score=18.87 TRINITY_DN950_c0_g1_i3:103-708(+)